jgi:hypothetical protein
MRSGDAYRHTSRCPCRCHVDGNQAEFVGLGAIPHGHGKGGAVGLEIRVGPCSELGVVTRYGLGSDGILLPLHPGHGGNVDQGHDYDVLTQ